MGRLLQQEDPPSTSTGVVASMSFSSHQLNDTVRRSRLTSNASFSLPRTSFDLFCFWISATGSIPLIEQCGFYFRDRTFSIMSFSFIDAQRQQAAPQQQPFQAVMATNSSNDLPDAEPLPPRFCLLFFTGLLFSLRSLLQPARVASLPLYLLQPACFLSFSYNLLVSSCLFPLFLLQPAIFDWPVFALARICDVVSHRFKALWN